MSYRLRQAKLKLFLALICFCGALCSGCGDGGSDGGDTESLPPIPPPNYDYEAAASHILIRFAGCVGCPPHIIRDRTAAQNLAYQVHMMAHERGADFAELAREYSEDEVTGAKGGFLGVFRRGQMVLAFDVAVFRLEPDRTGGVVETEFGFHIIKRHPIHRVRAAHLLIAWRGAVNASAAVTRTKAQAATLADEVHRMVSKKGADRCELVRKYSDDVNNRTTCGDLGVVQTGFLNPDFEKALFWLRPGKVSEVVETEFGYHITWQQP